MISPTPHLRRCIWLAALSVIVFTIGGILSPVTFAQEESGGSDNNQNQANPPNWRQARIALEHQFGKELVKIADWCRKQGLPQQVEQTYQLKIQRDPHRQYIFLPTTEAMPTPPDGPKGQWLEKINHAKRDHANRILELARLAADAEAGATAYQLLHEVLYYDRDHQEVRDMLGHKSRDDRWVVTSDKIRIRQSTGDQELFGWPAGSYWRVETPHFEIDSLASKERTLYLAEKLEDWYSVWRQVFFEYWSTPRVVARWISGKSKARPNVGNRSFKIYFFPDKNSYLATLANRVRGIAVSAGYYSSTEQASFFYDGGENEEATWRHELTHQLFREASRADATSLRNQYFWIDEGIACYFESMCQFNGYVTLGGFDTQRLQYSRLRVFLERYYVALKDLSAIGRDGFQQRADIKLLYSQVAGITNMLMNDRSGADEQAMVEFLRLVYKGRLKPDSLPQIIGRSFEELDQQYAQFLKVDSQTVAHFLTQPETRTELSVSQAGLDFDAYQAIGHCINLNWLDLSGNRITKAGMAELKECDRLSQLFMTQCQIDADGLQPLSELDNLQELEISGSAVQDHHLESLQGLNQLLSIRVVGTRVSDQGLLALAKIPSLKTVDVTNTLVTAQGVATFNAKRPEVVITFGK